MRGRPCSPRFQIGASRVSRGTPGCARLRRSEWALVALLLDLCRCREPDGLGACILTVRHDARGTPKRADAGVWPYDTLARRLTEKHSESMFVTAHAIKRDGLEYFWFDEATYCRRPSFEHLARPDR